MRDKADEIMDELLARDGTMTRAELQRKAIEQMRLNGENPNTPEGRVFLKLQLIALLAHDEEADALLAHANGESLCVGGPELELSVEDKELARDAIDSFADVFARKQCATYSANTNDSR